MTNSRKGRLLYLLLVLLLLLSLPASAQDSAAQPAYAAGWGVDPQSGQHRHRGTVGPFFSYLVIAPEARMVMVFLTNTGHEEGQPAAERAVSALLDRYANR